MQDFPANSQKAKARSEAPKPDERPKVERVTTAEAVQRKRGLGRKFKETIVEGSVRDTVEYMVVDIVIPEFQNLLYDTLEGGLRRLIHGDTHRPGTRSGGASSYSGIGPKINYQGMSVKPPMAAPPAHRSISRRSRTRQDFAEVVIDSRREADEVLEQMYEFLSRFGVVYIADLYDLTGIKTSHVDYQWGWTSLQGSRLARTRDHRWVLDLPEPISLE